MLYSARNRLITVFQFTRPSLDMPTSYSDPYRLALDSRILESSMRSGDHAGRQCLSGVMLLPLHYWSRPDLSPTGPGRQYSDEDVKFYKLLILGNDLSVYEAFLSNSLSAQPTHPPAMPLFPSIHTKARGRIGTSERRVAHKSFIVEDAFAGDSEQDSDDVLAQATIPRSSNAQRESMTKRHDVRSVDWEWLYELMLVGADRGRDAEEDDVLSLEERLQRKVDTKHRPLETLCVLPRRDLPLLTRAGMSCLLKHIL